MPVVVHPTSLQTTTRVNQRVALANLGLYENQRRAHQGLGFFDVGALVGGIFGASAAKRQAKATERAAQYEAQAIERSAQEQTKQAQLMAQAYATASANSMRAAERSAELELRAAERRSNNELASVQAQTRSALDALEVQRLAAVDQQMANLVNNTTAGTFQLASQGLTVASVQQTAASRAAMWGLVVLGIGTMAAIRYGRKGSSKRGAAVGGVA